MLPHVSEAEIVFLCVDTPSSRIDGSVDLSHIRRAAQDIGNALAHDSRIVLAIKSTVPPGANRLVARLVAEAGGASSMPARSLDQPCVSVVTNPEFLREGSAVQDFLYPDRIVLGSDDPEATRMMQTLYGPIVEQSFSVPSYVPQRPQGLSRVAMVITDPASAEMIKYASNAFLATKISLINEIANICECLGADVREVARGVGLDHRIGPHFMNAGLGWGGSCFGKDLRGLIWDARKSSYEPAMLQAAIDVNSRQRMIGLQKVREALRGVRGCAIAVWGLSFKPGTEDLRDAPSLELIEGLVSAGALVSVYDPVALEPFREKHQGTAVGFAKDMYHAVDGADALILVTEWPQFCEADWTRVRHLMNRPVIVDGRNCLPGTYLAGLGFDYHGIGVTQAL
jgi:UDPglucose 6-dehydrogenase